MLIKLIDPEREDLIPTRAHGTDGGVDIRTRDNIMLEPGAETTVHSGFCCEIPVGWVGLVFPRSGLGTKHGVVLKNTVGVIDAGYRGEVMLKIKNTGDSVLSIASGERVAQMVLVSCFLGDPILVDELSDSDRGTGGFGSTGNN